MLGDCHRVEGTEMTSLNVYQVCSIHTHAQQHLLKSIELSLELCGNMNRLLTGPEAQCGVVFANDTTHSLYSNTSLSLVVQFYVVLYNLW